MAGIILKAMSSSFEDGPSAISVVIDGEIATKLLHYMEAVKGLKALDDRIKGLVVKNDWASFLNVIPDEVEEEVYHCNWAHFDGEIPNEDLEGGCLVAHIFSARVVFEGRPRFIDHDYESEVLTDEMIEQFLPVE